MAVLFQMVNNAAANNSVDVLQYPGGLKNGIGYRVPVIGHDGVCVDCDTSRFAGFIESPAGYDLDRVSTKYWEAIFCNRCEVEGGSVSRNSMHEA